MEVGQLFAFVIGAYFLLLAGFAAITAAQALEEDDGAGLPMRVFWSLTKTTLFLGLPMLIGVLIFMNSEAKGGDSGIMSKGMGLFVLFLLGALGLLGLWIASITMGFLGAALTRNMQPMVGAAVLFFFISGAPLLMIGVAATTAAQRQQVRRR